MYRSDNKKINNLNVIYKNILKWKYTIKEGNNMDFIDYRKKLGIGFDDRELEIAFFHRMWNILDDYQVMCNQMTENEYIDFCMKVAYPINHDMENSDVWNEVMNIFDSNNRTVREFLPYYIFFVNCQNDDYADSDRYTKEQLIKLACNCLKNSHIPYELVKEENDYFIFPKGAEELDDALVSDVLIWLEEYHLSHKAFVKAIKEYSKLTDDNISTVADLFRKALETFFKEFFDSSKSLENLKSEYGNYMKSKDIPNELRSNFETLLQSYTSFNNGYAKHNDK